MREAERFFSENREDFIRDIRSILKQHGITDKDKLKDIPDAILAYAIENISVGWS